MNHPRNTPASLIRSAQDLTRIAARATGDATSPAVWRTLSILESEGPLRLGELAAATRVPQPTMTKLVQNLAGDDYIRRIADVDDSRAWLIATAAKGELALNAWRDHLASGAEAAA